MSHQNPVGGWGGCVVHVNAVIPTLDRANTRDRIQNINFDVAFIEMNGQPIIQSCFQYSSRFPQNMLPVFSSSSSYTGWVTKIVRSLLETSWSLPQTSFDKSLC